MKYKCMICGKETDNIKGSIKAPVCSDCYISDEWYNKLYDDLRHDALRDEDERARAVLLGLFILFATVVIVGLIWWVVYLWK